MADGARKPLSDFIGDAGVFADNQSRAIQASDSRDLSASVWPRLERINTAVNATAVAGQFIIADVTAGSLTVTMPASPTSGDVVAVKIFGPLSTVTVNGNGIDIETPFEVAIVGADARFFGDGATAIWVYTGVAWACVATAKLSAFSELWTGTPIVSIPGTPTDIVWTFQPLFPGQVPNLVTHAAGVLTKQFDRVLNVAVNVDFDLNPGQNADVSVEINLATAQLSFFPEIAVAFQSSRAGTFKLSGGSSGSTSGPAGSTFSITSQVTDGTGSADLTEAAMVLSL